jgi:hypothetical protein
MNARTVNVRTVLAVCLALLAVSLFSGIRYMAGGLVVVRPFDVGLAGLAVLFAGMVAISKRFPLPWTDPILLVFALYSVYMMLNGVLIGNTARSVNSLVQNVEFGLFLILIADLARRPRHRALFIKIFLWALGFIAVATACWYVAQGQSAAYKDAETKLAFGLFAFLAFALYYFRREQKYMPLLGMAVILMLLSGERKGWVAFSGGLVAVLTGSSLADKKNPLRALGPILGRGALAGLLVAFAVYVLSTQIEYVRIQVESFTKIARAMTAPGGFHYDVAGSGSNKVRLFLLEFTLETVPEHPLFGVGTGRFREMLERFARPGEELVGSHSWYQSVVVETGLVGLTMLVAIWGLMLKRGISLLRRPAPGQGFALIVALGLVGYGATISLFKGSGGALSLIYMMIPAGLLVGMTAEHKQWRKSCETSAASEQRGDLFRARP